MLPGRRDSATNRLTRAAPVSCRQALAPAAGTLAADRLGTMPSPWPCSAERAAYSVVGLRRSELLKAPKLFRRGRRMIHRPRTSRQVFLANDARKLSRELVRRCSACRLAAATSSPLCQQFGERRPVKCRWRHQTNRVGDDIALDRVVKRVVPRERRRRIDLDQVRLEVFVDETAANNHA